MISGGVPNAIIAQQAVEQFLAEQQELATKSVVKHTSEPKFKSRLRNCTIDSLFYVSLNLEGPKASKAEGASDESTACLQKNYGAHLNQLTAPSIEKITQVQERAWLIS